MRTPAERFQLTDGPFLPQLRGQRRQRSFGGSEHCRLGAENLRMAVGGSIAGLAGTVRSALLVNVDIAVGGVIMMFPGADRRRNVVHPVHNRRSRRSAERDGRDQEHKGGKEPAQDQHCACVSVTSFRRQDAGRLEIVRLQSGLVPSVEVRKRHGPFLA